MMRPWLIASVTTLVWAHSSAAAGGDPAQGGVIYKSNCVACHGASGRGDGPIATALTPPPADFASAASKKKSDADLLALIHSGVPNTSMPAYKSALSESQIQDVLAYVLTLRTKETATAPAGRAPGAAAAGRQPAVAAVPAPQAGAAVGRADTGAGIRADGATVYSDICAFCHDTNIGPVLGGRQLHPAYVQYIVRNGMAAMPAFRPAEIDDAALASLADYVAKLPGSSQ